MEVLVPIFGIFMIIAVTLGPIWLVTRAKQAREAEMHKTLRTMMETGQQLPPDVMQALKTDVPVAAARLHTPDRDLRGGVILIAVALALVTFGALASYQDDEIFYWLAGAACFPGFIGLARLAFGVIGRRRTSDLTSEKSAL